MAAGWGEWLAVTADYSLAGFRERWRPGKAPLRVRRLLYLSGQSARPTDFVVRNGTGGYSV